MARRIVRRIDSVDGLEEGQRQGESAAVGGSISLLPATLCELLQNSTPASANVIVCSRPQATRPRRADLQDVLRMVYPNRRVHFLEPTPQ